MNEVERVKVCASELRLSLEALEAINRKPKAPARSVSEMLAEWKDNPAQASPELRKQFGAIP